MLAREVMKPGEAVGMISEMGGVEGTVSGTQIVVGLCAKPIDKAGRVSYYGLYICGTVKKR